MNDLDYNHLREISWRRSLTPAESAAVQEYLAAHPSAQADWQDEAELNQFLEQLPAAPAVSSNFTARVLAAARLAQAARERETATGWFGLPGLRAWFPKAAIAGLAIGFTVMGYQQVQASNRAKLARNVVTLAKAVSANPQLVEDYEPIRQLSEAQPKVDTELLVLMK